MAWSDDLTSEQIGDLLALAELELRVEQERRTRRWDELARPDQRPPQDWDHVWLILAGRGWGKTRTGAETVGRLVAEGRARRIAVVGATLTDVRDVAIAALRAAAGPSVTFVESQHLPVRWPNGAEALGFSAEDPDSLRGYEFDLAWCDELAAWRYPEAPS
jgi:phage terminase large subunit-like protein